MAADRVLLIEHPAYLCVDRGRLHIRSETRDAFVAPEDVAVVCLHHPAITVSVAALQACAAGGAAVLTVNDKHHPLALHLPLHSTRSALRLRAQMRFDRSERAALAWRDIVAAKLRTQARNLRHHGRKGALQLERLALKVQPSDAGQAEGQGARHYWKHLFEGGFHRQKEGAEDLLNASLNWGYAVMRSMVARAIACAGLNACLGFGHVNRENVFALADDLIEPFRFLVERQVVALVTGGASSFDVGFRRELLRFVEGDIELTDGKCNKGQFRVPAAVEETVASYVRYLESAGPLVLPTGA